jgi:hypothetical protein
MSFSPPFSYIFELYHAMKKRINKPEDRNPVAQHAQKFNRCLAFQDRTAYRRREKHKNREFSAPCLFRGKGMARSASIPSVARILAQAPVIGPILARG